MEGLLVRCSVEVKVTSKDLIRTLARQHHLDAHRLDLAGEQEHRCGGANRGDVVGLEVEDNVGKGVESLLDGECEVVVLGAEELGDLSGGLGVWSAWKTDGEGVKLGEDWDGGELVLVVDTGKFLLLGGCLVAVGSAVLLCRVLLLQSQGLPLRDGGDEGRVKTTREKNTVRNLGHQPLPDCPLE